MRLPGLTFYVGFSFIFLPTAALAGQATMDANKVDLRNSLTEFIVIDEYPALPSPQHFSLVQFPAITSDDVIDDVISAPYLIEPASYDAPRDSALASALRRVETPDLGPYNVETFVDQTATVSLDLIGILALNTYYGMSSEDWGSVSFHFDNEGWFGKNTYALGMDKLGHAYGTYLYSEYFTQRIAHSSDNVAGAAITGAVLAFGVQSSVEVFDAFSTDFGFSNQDLIMDGVGAGFSVLRSTVPGLAEKLDFRMEYVHNAKVADFSPFNDYTGQKYLLALKLSGFEDLEDTPLRFVELQAGYFARGFTDREKAAGVELRREPYLAIGFNLQELLDAKPVRDTVPALLASRTLEYIQLPYTYAATTQN